MSLTKIEVVRLYYGDTPRNPFYPILTDEEIESYLDTNDDDVFESAKMAAFSAAYIIANFNTKEMFGDVEAWNEASKQYRAVLELFIRESRFKMPRGLIPYCAGISYADLQASASDPDNARVIELQKIFDPCEC